MSTVAFLGLGAMGSRMAPNVAAAGHRLRLFNRSGAKAAALAIDGAQVCTSPREAVAGADFVISMVTDDAAARAVWLEDGSGAVGGLASDCVVIESSTVTPGWVAELDGHVQAAGAHLLDAPVAGTLPHAEQRTLVFFVGGQAAALARARPLLLGLGGALHHVGATGTGAILKLAVNGLYATQVAALGETLGWLRKMGLSPAAMMTVLATLPTTSAAAVHAGTQIVAGTHQPLFPVALVDKDLAYAVGVARGAGAQTPVLDAVGAAFGHARRTGDAANNLTAVAKQFMGAASEPLPL